ncbi:MAG: M14 family metallopeptidase [Gammaproteobacteria bacterium]
MLTILEELPEGILDCPSEDLHRILPGPTLIHLTGRQPKPLFASILLHGNEDTGLKAVQLILRKYESKQLPRSLSVFVANVFAAQQRVRRLDGQPDYNRVWPGADTHGLAEHAMMREVVEQMRSRNVFASIDLHNNTGINPRYACVNSLEPPFLHLAVMFSRTVVYFQRPLGVQSMAFTRLCPSVTVECGKTGDAEGDANAAEFLDACLHMSALPVRDMTSRDVDLFQTVATVRIPSSKTFSFGNGDADIQFEPDLDHMNFQELDADTVWGRTKNSEQDSLDVTDEHGNNVYREYFAFNNGIIRLQKRIMPAMLTLDSQVIRQDCLCYLMKRLSI